MVSRLKWIPRSIPQQPLAYSNIAVIWASPTVIVEVSPGAAKACSATKIVTSTRLGKYCASRGDRRRFRQQERRNPDQDDSHVANRRSARDDPPGAGPIPRRLLSGRRL